MASLFLLTSLLSSPFVYHKFNCISKSKKFLKQGDPNLKIKLFKGKIWGSNPIEPLISLNFHNVIERKIKIAEINYENKTDISPVYTFGRHPSFGFAVHDKLERTEGNIIENEEFCKKLELEIEESKELVGILMKEIDHVEYFNICKRNLTIGDFEKLKTIINIDKIKFGEVMCEERALLNGENVLCIRDVYDRWVIFNNLKDKELRKYIGKKYYSELFFCDHILIVFICFFIALEMNILKDLGY